MATLWDLRLIETNGLLRMRRAEIAKWGGSRRCDARFPADPTPHRRESLVGFQKTAGTGGGLQDG